MESTGGTTYVEMYIIIRDEAFEPDWTPLAKIPDIYMKINEAAREIQYTIPDSGGPAVYKCRAYHWGFTLTPEGGSS